MKTETALILLPTEYNPDCKGRRQQIPMRDFQKTAAEIDENFGVGCTVDLYPKYGFWAKAGVVYEDVNVILEINSLPKDKKKWFIKYCKDKLLDRFKQKAILIKFIPQIQVTLVTVKK